MTEFFDDAGVTLEESASANERLRHELASALASGRLPPRIWAYADELDASFAEADDAASTPIDDRAEVAEVVRRRRAGELAGTRIAGNENPFLDTFAIARKAWMRRRDAQWSGEQLSVEDAVAAEIRFVTAAERYRQERIAANSPVSIEEAMGHVFQIDRLAKLTGLTPAEIEATDGEPSATELARAASAFAEQARRGGRFVSSAAAVERVAGLLKAVRTRSVSFAERRELGAADIAELARGYQEAQRKRGVIVSSADAVRAVLRARDVRR